MVDVSEQLTDQLIAFQTTHATIRREIKAHRVVLDSMAVKYQLIRPTWKSPDNSTDHDLMRLSDLVMHVLTLDGPALQDRVNWQSDEKTDENEDVTILSAPIVPKPYAVIWRDEMLLSRAPSFQRGVPNLKLTCWFNATIVVLSHVLLHFGGKAPWIGTKSVDDKWLQLVAWAEQPSRHVDLVAFRATVEELLVMLTNDQIVIRNEFNFAHTGMQDVAEPLTSLLGFSFGSVSTRLNQLTLFKHDTVTACVECNGPGNESSMTPAVIFASTVNHIHAESIHMLVLTFPDELQLFPHKEISLQSMIHAFSSTEEVHLRCSNGNKAHVKQRARRAIRFTSAPSCLVIQLARMQAGERVARNPVLIPDVLPFQYFSNSRVSATAATVNYTLMATITQDNAHYWAHARAGQLLHLLPSWSKFDDRIKTERVRYEVSSDDRKNATVLFYARR